MAASGQKVDKSTLEKPILRYIHEHGQIDNTREWSPGLDVAVDHDAIVGCLKSLGSDGYVSTEEIKKETWVLTEEAQDIVQNGSPEYHFCLQLPAEGMPVKEASKQFSQGFGKAKKAQWVSIDKGQVMPAVRELSFHG